MTPFPLDGGRAGDGGGRRRPDEVPRIVRNARRLRKEMTFPEKRLWAELRGTKLHVRRQAPLGRYIADFVSHDCRLVIEVDGAPHEVFADRALRDIERDAWLATQGYRALRFTNAQVMEQMEQVLSEIDAAALPPPSPTLPPSRGKGE